MRTFLNRRAGAWTAGALLALAACSPERVVSDAKLPSGVADPTLLHNASGAVAAYHASLVAFRKAFNNTVAISGLLTDELQSGAVGQPITLWDFRADVDSRSIPELTDPNASLPSSDGQIPAYFYLQTVRGQVQEAKGLLADFGGDTVQALAGHSDAIEGYADVLLADLYCSGIPLSTLDYDGDYTLASGSTTADVYERAVALFDSALTLAADSARVMNLARVGKGRALLALGRYADAALAVADVPDDFAYQVLFTTGDTIASFANQSAADAGMGPWRYTTTDREGINGLDYRSSRDPRVAAVAIGANRYGQTIYHPTKYNATGTTPIVLASGIEARLIEAEAALVAGSASWLTTLNALRTDGTFDTQPSDTNPAVTDTLWHAGAGGVAGLAPLADPGTPDARVDLLFRERAFWLYLTGQRQGDLRRLIRQYGRTPAQVYPTGPYPGASGLYSGDVTIPVPAAERAFNSKYTGCINRGA
ncbi:MAG: hypothetical protein IRY91_08275 [Gemmatimonadaceae bacterium]|nr:hypothetical protein [Gemmatimonadaceae bacterium]